MQLVDGHAPNQFPAAPLGGLEKLVTVANLLLGLAALIGGLYASQNVHFWGGVTAAAAGVVVLVLALLNRTRVPDLYELGRDELHIRRGERELECVAFDQLYEASLTEPPYLPHGYSLDPRGTFADAFGWNGTYTSVGLGTHRLLGTSVAKAVTLKGEELWVVTPADPPRFVAAIRPHLRGKPPKRKPYLETGTPS